jgi:hypothetical protein
VSDESINEYGNYALGIGTSFTLEGVHLWVKDPASGKTVKLLTLEPEFARRVAERLTIDSFSCDDARRDAKGQGKI